MSEVADLLARLVAIDSVNPSLVPGGAGEAEIVAFIEGWARAAGLEVTRLESTPGRPSVVVRAPGRGGGASLLLCGHVDTVTTAGMAEPHAARIEGDRLYGRGAYDMKAGVAAALVACREASALDLAGDVLVAAVADEEHASLGIQEVLEHVRADTAIVTEPTELQLAVAHKGFVWAEIEITGRAAHGSRPHLGVDAIAAAGPVLTAIADLDRALAQRTHPLLDRGSVHASLITGGAELSSYPARCTIGLERRTLPGETAADVENELDALVAACPAPAEHRTLLVREPFEVDPDVPFVRAVAEVTGAPLAGASYWADAAFIAAAGIPTVMLGPGGQGAHAAEEWVSVPDTEAVARMLVDVARQVCA
jgi:acetylornithine deacetylase